MNQVPKISQPPKNGMQKTDGGLLSYILKLIALFAVAAYCMIHGFPYPYITEELLRRKYRQQDLEIPVDLIQDTSVEKQIEFYIRRQKYNEQYVDFLVGAPETGKTTAIKNIINKIRKEGKKDGKRLDVYYFNLRIEGNKMPNTLTKKVDQLVKLISAICKSHRGKIVRLVVDNIEQMEQLEDKTLKLETENLFGCLQRSNIHIVLVSSSSSHAMQCQNSSISKSADFILINMPTQNQIEQIIERRLRRYQLNLKSEQKQEVLKKAKQFILKVDPPPMMIELWLRQYRIKNGKVSLDKILQKEVRQFTLNRRLQVEILTSQAGFLFSQAEDRKIIKRLFQLISNSPDKISMYNPTSIKSQLNDDYLAKVSKLMYKLQKRQFVIYGKPICKLYQRIFQQIEYERNKDDS